MANPVYIKIREELDAKRRRAQKDAIIRKNEIYAKFPRLAELDRLINLSASEYSMQIINGENVEDEMKQALRLLSKQKNACLLENGLTQADFEPKYSCRLCNDTGITDGQYCTCFKARVIEENFKSSNIGASLNHQTFDSFNLGYYSDDKFESYPRSPLENMKRNLMVCKTFADNFDNVKKSLLLLGATGLGKTYLSTCVAKQLLESGKSVIYISAVDFFKSIEKSRFDQTDTDVKLFESCDLLIIDDLGTEAPSAYTTAVFSDILDKRTRYENKMILSSNLNTKELKKMYGERVDSRLAGSFEYLIFYGKDIRIQKFMTGVDKL